MTDKRIPVPSTVILKTHLESFQSDLRQVIDVDLNSYETAESLHNLSQLLKDNFKKYCSVNYEMVKRFISIGSEHEALSLRDDRIAFRNEVNELILLINVKKQNDNSESESILAESIASTHEANDMSFPIRDPIPCSPSNHDINAEKVNAHDSISQTLSKMENLLLPTTTCSPLVQTQYSTDPYRLTYNAADSLHGSVPHVSSQVRFSLPSDRLSYSHNNNVSVPPFRNFVNPVTSSTSRQFSNFQPSNPAFGHSSFSATVGSSRTPPIPGRQVGYQGTMTDINTFHTLRQQLLQKFGKSFSGDPHEYHSWINCLTNRTRGLQIEPWDVLTMLHTNTAGRPQKLVERYMGMGGINPDETLQKVWTALYDQYGSSARIANSLLEKVKFFSAIKNANDHEQLYDLFSLCQLIQCNISASSELQVFNFSLGLRQIWEKLPFHFQNQWRDLVTDYQERSGHVHPPFNDFVSFLEKRCKEVNNPCYSRPVQQSQRQAKHQSVTLKTSDAPEKSQQAEVEQACPLHPNGKHPLTECRAFAKLPFPERRNLLMKEGRCFKCCGKHHRSKCDSQETCSSCGGNHVSVMHKNDSNTSNSFSQVSTGENQNSSNLCVRVCGDGPRKDCSKTLLVDVSVPSKSNKTLRCYCIIDEQSSKTFADSSLVDYFGLSCPVNEYNLTTLSNHKQPMQGKIIHGVKVRGVKEKRSIHLPPTLTNDSIPDCRHEVASPSVVSSHKHISHLSKHFPEFDPNSRVLIIIGRDCGPAMATKCFGYKTPFAHHTPLGWALVGSACSEISDSAIDASILKVNTDQEHFGAENRFLDRSERHNCSVRDIFAEHADDEMIGLSKDDYKFMDIVSNRIHTDENNSIVLPLPFRSDSHNLPDNKLPVYLRTRNTLNRLKQDSNKLHQCIDTMGKYLLKDHVEKIPDSERNNDEPGQSWYIPVFPVDHPKKEKTRLVFDSSACYHGTSLNNALLQGPDLTSRLRAVLLRFRNGEIAFSADVESMFHAFRLEPQDRNFTKFFWWDNNDSSQALTEYRAKVHVFGNRSSPALANLGLRYAAKSNSDVPRSISDFISNHFYVDDGCKAVDTAEAAIELLESTIEVLSRNNIRLHKITSNSPTVLQHFPSSERADISSPLQPTLGIGWNVISDELVVSCKIPDRPFTKRGVLATVNTLYDPLGFISPLILTGRLLQRTFLPPAKLDSELNQLDWDDPLPVHLRNAWDNWKSSVIEADGAIHIPRCYYPKNFSPIQEQSLHVFSDASLDAIGHVMYIRSTNTRKEVHVSFVCASSRVAPRSALSVPRLELCAAVEAATASKQISTDLGIDSSQVYLYSDSQVVLGYLKNTTTAFTRYVTRRVNLIQKNFPESHWSYVPTCQNPGDIASRAQTSQSLNESCWFRGPSFLWDQVLESPVEVDNSVELPEVRHVLLKTVTKAVSPIFTLCSNISSWTKVIRVYQKILRYVDALRESVMLRKGAELARNTFPPYQAVETRLVFAAQTDAYEEVFKALRSDNHPVPRILANFSLFIDSEGLIRVGGRLNQSGLEYNVKHPILLPSQHPLTLLLIRHHHDQVKHQGRIITMGAIRSSGLFIQNGSSLVKKFIRDCVTCRKLRGRFEIQKMSDLPRDRLEQDPPFTNTGMDVFGPFLVSDGISTRNRSRTSKSWAIVFTCLVSRAVHVEVLPSLDISAFKNSLRRFFCLRGTCRRLRCDQGTNFIGAKGQEEPLSLDELNRLSTHQVEWDLNPPRASHFGGIWERKIGSIRRILDATLRQLGPRLLSRDEFHTFLVEASSIINNTPMWEISNNPDDPFPLTPAMILFANSQPNPPTFETFSEKDILAYGPKRWRRVQSLADQFWSRWRTHYVHNLQTRSKWLYEKESLKPGDVVLLRDKQISRNLWPLAKVTEAKVSRDGLVRSVTLAVASRHPKKTVSILNRPISEVILVLRK